MRFKNKLNDRFLYDEFGLVIQSGTEALLAYPERKESYENDWREENGVERDLKLIRFKDKEVGLSCAFIADTDQEFWDNYHEFFNEIAKNGYQDLYIEDHSKTYSVSYKRSSQFVKTSKRLKNVDLVFVKFRLTLVVYGI